MPRIHSLLFITFLWLVLLGCNKSDSPISTENWTYFATKDGLVDNNINDMTIDLLGNIWVATEFGVSRFDGSLWSKFNTPQGLIHHQVNAVAVGTDQKVWFATPFGVSSFHNNQWNSYTETDGLGYP